jgi:hypothetical protein
MRHSTGIEINLLVGGIRLQEYDRAAVETEPKPVLSSRYVEAVAETNFEVEVCVPRYTAPSCEDSILAIVFLDGKRVAGIHGNLKEGGLSRPIRREGVVRNTLEGGRLAKFAFGKLQTSKSMLIASTALAEGRLHRRRFGHSRELRRLSRLGQNQSGLFMGPHDWEECTVDQPASVSRQRGHNPGEVFERCGHINPSEVSTSCRRGRSTH